MPTATKMVLERKDQAAEKFSQGMRDDYEAWLNIRTTPMIKGVLKAAWRDLVEVLHGKEPITFKRPARGAAPKP